MCKTRSTWPWPVSTSFALGFPDTPPIPNPTPTTWSLHSLTKPNTTKNSSPRVDQSVTLYDSCQSLCRSSYNPKTLKRSRTCIFQAVNFSHWLSSTLWHVLLFLSRFVFVIFWDRVSICCPEWPKIYGNPPASGFQAMYHHAQPLSLLINMTLITHFEYPAPFFVQVTEKLETTHASFYPVTTMVALACSPSTLAS